ncbi:hypothetical protein TYRP_018681 [Tyrophagus putrescentiae]|nr:hypothetical protein TYRP_018681 [Tyrophagus putrescentiae]
MTSTDPNIVKSKLPSFPIPSISMGEFLHSCYEEIIRQRPDAVALIDSNSGQTLTHKQLSDAAKKVASALLALEVPLESSDLAFFFAENSLPFFILHLALAYLGLPFTPNKPSNGAYETAYQLENSGASLLLISSDKLPVIRQVFENPEYAHLLKQLKLVVLMDDLDDEVSAEINSIFSDLQKVVSFSQLNSTENQDSTTFSIPHLIPADPSTSPYAIVYTSGSTGLPKGAVLSHRAYISTFLSSLQAKCFTGHTDDLVLFAAPFGHISGVYFSGVFLLSGARLLVIDSMQPMKVISAWARYRVSYGLIAALHGAAILELVESKTIPKEQIPDLSCTKTMLTSGGKFHERVARGLIAKFGLEFNEIYGSTEFMGAVFNNESSWEPGNLGQPLANVEMKIVDLENLNHSLPANKQGEIWFRGPSCFTEYLKKPGSDRLDDRRRGLELIKYKSWSVAPAEVEACIGHHRQVAAVCVVGVPHATEGAHLRAYVELKKDALENTEVIAEEIVNLVKENMGYMKRLNGGVVFIPSMPRISVGKVDRKHFAALTKGELLTEPAPVLLE